MTVSDEAVEAAARALWLGGTKEPHRIRRLREALTAAAPFIAAQALRVAADNLEIRMDQSDPGSYAEQQYQAGYADAIARLILHPSGKA